MPAERAGGVRCALVRGVDHRSLARASRRSLLRAALLSGAALAACAPFVACSSDDGGDPDVDRIAWVSPGPSSEVDVGESIELTVKVNDTRVSAVRFAVDGRTVSTCDGAPPGDDCRRGDLFRFTTSFAEVGRHHLVASTRVGDEELSAAVDLSVVPQESTPPSDDDDDASAPGAKVDGGKADAGPTKPANPPATNRGFLDPDRASHNVFGGVSWSVAGQTVKVAAAPAGSVAAIAACMKKYGPSIVKHGDGFKVSRASVIATAITESNCTNPSGSSDGLSSGPMQVTGSTCASVAGGGISSAACKSKMFTSPDFSFQIGAKYMGSTYQLKQHTHDPPKIAAAYNAGSIRQSSANRWHMIVTGNHIERFVAAYNAYRAWEATTTTTKLALDDEIATRADTVFDGEHVANASDLPRAPREGQVYFVGDWSNRIGAFVTFRDGAWVDDFAASAVPAAP